MGKYDIFETVAVKIKAVDNPIKLKILALLIEEGSKSITDISKDLDINFSTTHKYLEQLEAAGLVTSKQVSENRLKRLFYINDFDVQLSPSGISNLISATNKTPSKIKTFKVINESGEFVEFDEKVFSQKYLKRGMPRGLISNALASILEKVYDGITIHELRESFKDELNKRMQNILDVTKQITIAEGHKRTYKTIMQFSHPEALQEHANGDIFITNLDAPKLLNFVHDIRGIAIHGVDGKKPNNLQELYEQIFFVIDFTSKFSSNMHSFDTFNYFIAPFTKNLNEIALKNELSKFFETLDKKRIKTYICLEIGVPEFVKNLPIAFLTETATNKYEDYTKTAANIADISKDLFEKNKYENLRLIVKLWEKIDLNWPAGTYVVNMKNKWQLPNAGFVAGTRLNPKWKNWLGTNRSGEIQEIVINVPRIAQNSVSFKDFVINTDKLITKCCDYIENMAELTLGEFLRKKNTQLKSVQRIRWNYAVPEDFTYTISLTGVKTAIDIINKNDSKRDVYEKLLKHCSKVIERKIRIPIRVLLKENSSSDIANRFYSLDSKVNSKLKPYIPGAGLEIRDLDIQSYLWGGYCSNVKKSDLKFVKDFGMIRIME